VLCLIVLGVFMNTDIVHHPFIGTCVAFKWSIVCSDYSHFVAHFNPCVWKPMYSRHACGCMNVCTVCACVYLAVDLRTDSAAAVYRGQPRADVKPDCTITVSDSDFIDMAAGKLDANEVCYYVICLHISYWNKSVSFLSSFICP